MIFREGLYRGLTFWVATISAWSLSRIFFAMAVPSILVAVIAEGVLEETLCCDVCGSVDKEKVLVPQVGVVRFDDRQNGSFRPRDFTAFLTATPLETARLGLSSDPTIFRPHGDRGIKAACGMESAEWCPR